MCVSYMCASSLIMLLLFTIVNTINKSTCRM